MSVSDVNVGDRVMYDGEVCEVLRVDRPASAPVRVLVAEYIDDPGDGRPYGARTWASQDELDPVLENQAGDIIGGDDEVPGPAPLADEWGDSLPANVVALLVEHNIGVDEAYDLGAKGLTKLKGIGKATAAKILDAIEE